MFIQNSIPILTSQIKIRLISTLLQCLCCLCDSQTGLVAGARNSLLLEHLTKEFRRPRFESWFGPSFFPHPVNLGLLTTPETDMLTPARGNTWDV